MILGVYGWQDSGKTTLVEKLIVALSDKGYSVSTIKHAPHEDRFDVDGKDSRRHSKAGGRPVVLQTGDETVIMVQPGMSVGEVSKLLAREFRPDVLLVEGYKDGGFPKVAVGDIEPTEGTVLVNPGLEEVVEYICREVDFERAYDKLPKLDCGKCGLTCKDLAREIAEGNMTVDECRERPACNVEIVAGGERLPVGAFVAEMTEKTIRGFLSSLRGYSGSPDVEIRLSSWDDATDCEE